MTKKKKKHRRKGNPKYQDSLFRWLFSSPEKAIELYNAIENTNYGPDTDVDLTTLREVFFNDRNNDLSFIIACRSVILLEHQSTICRNIPLRLLGYSARTFEELVSGSEIYSTALKKIPVPQFYVLYTGDEPWPEEVLCLSDAFLLPEGHEKIPENSLELVVKVIDLRYTEDNPILKRSETLAGYSRLIHYIKTGRKSGLTLEASIDAAIDRCLKENVLTDFLKNKREVSNMILGEGVTLEEIIAVRERDARNYGLNEGISQGITQGLSMGLQKGGIKTLIEDNLEEGIAKDRIIAKLIRRFDLSEEEAQKHYEETVREN